MIVPPAHATLLDIVERKEIEAPARFLILAQDDPLGTPAPPPIRFHRDRLDVEKDHDAVGGQVLKNPTNTG